MKYRKLGHTGFEVSDIAHGLWGMGGWSGSDDEESLKALQLAVELGCNFFDSAWAYGDGKSDGLLGEIIARTYYESQNKPIYALREVKSHRKEMGDSTESTRPSGNPDR